MPRRSDSPESLRKAQIDALLLKLPGVSARKINGLDAYFVSDRMFACISGAGIGLRLPAATATELQFSRDNVVPFQPGGMRARANGSRSTAPTRPTTRRTSTFPGRPRVRESRGPEPVGVAFMHDRSKLTFRPPGPVLHFAPQGYRVVDTRLYQAVQSARRSGSQFPSLIIMPVRVARYTSRKLSNSGMECNAYRYREVV